MKYRKVEDEIKGYEKDIEILRNDLKTYGTKNKKSCKI